MFAIIGKGQYSKEDLAEFLSNLGLSEPYPVVKEIERRGAVMINNLRIMYVR